MKLKLKVIKSGKLFFYAVIQVLTLISLSAYVWRPNLKPNNNTHLNLANYSFSDSDIIYNFTKNLIQSTLAQIHEQFSLKYSEIKGSYPSTSKENQALLTTFMMKSITDPINPFYRNLTRQIKNLVLYNITNQRFEYADSILGKELVQKNIILPNYLSELKTTNIVGGGLIISLIMNLLLLTH